MEIQGDASRRERRDGVVGIPRALPAAPCFTERERLYAEADVAQLPCVWVSPVAYSIRPGSARCGGAPGVAPCLGGCRDAPGCA